MSQPEATELVPALNTRPANRVGSTALIVLAISLGMLGALLALQGVGQLDMYDRGVLRILAITVGIVGSIWAFVLLVRGVRGNEPMIGTFAIFLTVYGCLSVPLIRTWDSTDRGIENNWYFVHHACVSLCVPLLTLAFLFATPLFVRNYRRARRSEEAQRAEFTWRAWRTLFLTAGLFFAAVFPVSFYIYGGTMAAVATGEHWTTKVVRVLPRGLGNIGFRMLRCLPENATNDTRGLLISRGLVSANFLIDTIESLSKSSEQDAYFNHLARNYPTEALAFARMHFSHYPPTSQSLEMAAYFAQHASDSEVRGYLTLERYNVLSGSLRSGLNRGLDQRANIKDFVPDLEKLWGGDEKLPRVALHLLLKYADDATAKRVYMETIERKDESLQHATFFLIGVSRVSVFATGISQPNMSKQQLVLQAVLANQEYAPYISLMRIRNDPAFRLAILRAQDSPDIDNRVMNALIIHQLSNAMSPALQKKYGLKTSGKGTSTHLTPARLWQVDLAERNVLIAQARELMRKW